MISSNSATSRSVNPAQTVSPLSLLSATPVPLDGIHVMDEGIAQVEHPTQVPILERDNKP